MREELAHRFELFGSSVGINVGAPRDPRASEPRLVALALETSLRRAHRALSRFEPASELSRLNADPARVVAASPLLCELVSAASWAAERSEGLVDASVIGQVEAAGYRESRRGREPAPLAAALADAPARRPARRRDPSPFDQVEVDTDAGLIARPPGLRFDSGGIAKGLLADRCATALGGYSSYAIDCGGDLRIGGVDGLERRLELTDPFTGEAALGFGLTAGAVATSGLRRRVWRVGDRPAHHLIDPGRGEPAWTGLIQATAVAPTALEAETLAKAALLSGPREAERWLSRWGGVVFDDEGEAQAFGPLEQQLAQPAAAVG